MVIKFGDVLNSEEGGRTEDINDCWLVACPFKLITRSVLLQTRERNLMGLNHLLTHASALVWTTPHRWLWFQGRSIWPCSSYIHLFLLSSVRPQRES